MEATSKKGDRPQRGGRVKTQPPRNARGGTNQSGCTLATEEPEQQLPRNLRANAITLSAAWDCFLPGSLGSECGCSSAGRWRSRWFARHVATMARPLVRAAVGLATASVGERGGTTRPIRAGLSKLATTAPAVASNRRRAAIGVRVRPRKPRPRRRLASSTGCLSSAYGYPTARAPEYPADWLRGFSVIAIVIKPILGPLHGARPQAGLPSASGSFFPELCPLILG